jgi:hypothetical protein
MSDVALVSEKLPVEFLIRLSVASGTAELLETENSDPTAA